MYTPPHPPPSLRFRGPCPGVEVSTLGQFDCVGSTSLYYHQPYPTTVKVKWTSKCLKMNVQEFKRLVQPILLSLEQNARQFNTFIYLIV